MVCALGAGGLLRSRPRVANVLAYSEQTVGCTYVSWSYSSPFAEPAAGGANTAGSCYLKNGTAKLPVGSTYSGENAGAARGVVFSSVSQPGTHSNAFRKIKIHGAGREVKKILIADGW